MSTTLSDPSLTLDSLVRVPKDVLFRELSGEIVLLNTATGKYFSLDASGACVWQALKASGNLRDAQEALLRVYDVTKTQAGSDVLDLASKLCAHKLLERAAEDQAPRQNA